ncbi:hypothetical protein CKAH01_10719 [Colletotrichum kahawae]|uniref:Uncharacterized protein n=1 Tax=Colletotrichum kahawae TaxID=34407 RepID=A0AAD9XWR3_COLKA|nr:hypothetical protein CKAH01_10719 [Colletotrichum kahawae]
MEMDEMALSPTLNLPLRIVEPRDPNLGEKKRVSALTSVDNASDVASTSDNQNTKNDREKDAAGNDCNDASHVAANLGPLQLSIPIMNYSAHPNVKMLPGMDFGVGEGAPIISQNKSGLLGRIIFPHDSAAQPPSNNGVFKVSERIRTIMDVAIRTYLSREGVSNVRQLFHLTFLAFRTTHKSWNFESADRKLVPIMGTILNARKLFLKKGGDTSKIHCKFLPFLNSIDEFIEVVEPGLEARKAVSNAEMAQTLRSRKRTNDQAPLFATKKRRMSEEHEEVASKTPEEQVSIWRAKARDLEEKLAVTEESYRKARDAKSFKGWLECARWIEEFWNEARPALNDRMRIEGKQEWDEAQLEDFLRSRNLHHIANGVLGVELFGSIQ